MVDRRVRKSTGWSISASCAVASLGVSKTAEWRPSRYSATSSSRAVGFHASAVWMSADCCNSSWTHPLKRLDANFCRATLPSWATRLNAVPLCHPRRPSGFTRKSRKRIHCAFDGFDRNAAPRDRPWLPSPHSAHASNVGAPAQPGRRSANPRDVAELADTQRCIGGLIRKKGRDTRAR